MLLLFQELEMQYPVQYHDTCNFEKKRIQNLLYNFTSET